jgi:hypothetical protein
MGGRGNGQAARQVLILMSRILTFWFSGRVMLFRVLTCGILLWL